MELALIVWAVGTLPSIAKGLITCGVLLTSFGIFTKLFCACNGIDTDDLENESHSDKTIAKLVKPALYIGAPLWLVGAIIPDKETSYQMLAAYGVQTIVENETTKALASDGVEVLQGLMAKAKRELVENTNKVGQ